MREREALKVYFEIAGTYAFCQQGEGEIYNGKHTL